MWANATSQGFIVEYYDNHTTYSSADRVSVTVPDTTSGIDFALDVGGRITGVVTSAATDTPLVNVRVTACQFDGGNCYGASTATDGTYTIGGLASGDYRVYANATSQGFIREYYDNHTSSGSADRVSVTVPNTTLGIDFTLEVGGSITGTVTRADTGVPISFVIILACPYDGGGDCNLGFTGEDGTYTIGGLASGGYRVYTASERTGLLYLVEYYNNKATSSVADPVSVTVGYTTANIDFSLALAGVIPTPTPTPTTSAPTPTPTPIPSLNWWGMVALAGGLALLILLMRRRQIRSSSSR